MTSPIVETLWQRIRDNLTDKIGEATALVQQAFDRQQAANAAATRAESAATAAETAASEATSAAVTEVAKVVDGAPAAFDTLAEIATELAANESERAALTTTIAGKADVGHTHTIAQVSDMPTMSYTPEGGSIPRYGTGGRLQVGVPVDPYDAVQLQDMEDRLSSLASKAYVDARPAFFSVPGTTVPTTIPGAAVGDHVLTLGNMKIHKITGV